MRPLMLLQGSRELEALSAMGALPRPLARMAQHVVLQVRRVLISLSASFASKRSFTSVHALMSLHVPNLRKSLSAYFTTEWPLSGVYTQVASQHLWSRECLVAKGARYLESGSFMIALVLL